MFSAVGVKSTRYKTLQNFLSYPQNLNRYSYCLNNPVKYVDPDGKSVVGIGTILALILGVVCLGAFMAPAVISSQIGQNQVINSQIEYASRIDNGQDTASATNGQSLGKQGIYASEAMAIVVYKGIKDGSSKIQGKIFGFRAPSNVMKSLAMPLKVQGVFDQTNSFLESRLDEALDNFKKEHQENNQKQKQFKQDKKEKSQ